MSQEQSKDAILEAYKNATDPDERLDIAKSAAAGSVERVGFEATASASVGTLWKSDDDFVIWGPASVEIVDKENDRIKAEALEKAIPQLLKRSALSYEHTDQIVGEILDKFETEEPVEVQIGDTKTKRSEFPTDVLKGELDHPALFVAGNIYGDTEKSQEVREQIEKGNIDSYSISGEAVVTSMAVEDGRPVTDISKLDLSAVTLCSEGMNQLAKFGVVKKMDTEGSGGSAELGPEQAREIISKTMSNNQKTLTKQGMEDILDKHLPDGEIATQESVRSIAKEEAEKVLKENATNTGSPTEGTPERPGGEDENLEQDPEYEGDAEDEAVSDSDKVEEKSTAAMHASDEVESVGETEEEEGSEGMTMDELKSALPADQFKAIKPTLEEKMETVDPEVVEDPDDDGEEEMPLGEEEPAPPAEDPMEEEEEDEIMAAGARKAKTLGLSPDNLTEDQQKRLAKTDLDEVDGAGFPGTNDDAPAATGEDLSKNASPGQDTTMAGSNFFDENGAPKL